MHREPVDLHRPPLTPVPSFSAVIYAQVTDSLSLTFFRQSLELELIPVTGQLHRCIPGSRMDTKEHHPLANNLYSSVTKAPVCQQLTNSCEKAATWP